MHYARLRGQAGVIGELKGAPLRSVDSLPGASTAVPCCVLSVRLTWPPGRSRSVLGCFYTSIGGKGSKILPWFVRPRTWRRGRWPQHARRRASSNTRGETSPPDIAGVEPVVVLVSAVLSRCGQLRDTVCGYDLPTCFLLYSHHFDPGPPTQRRRDEFPFSEATRTLHGRRDARCGRARLQSGGERVAGRRWFGRRC